MSTRSCVIIKVRPADIGKMMKYNKDLTPVKENDWGNEIDKDKAEEVKITAAYLGIYCHWDGYPNGVGAALKANFKTYEQALNLVIGGGCSAIDNEYVLRYATRKNEDWEYLSPMQNDDLNEVASKFNWSEYDYLFTEEDGWKVNDIYEGGGFKSF
jgi:hypothetical protein